MLSVFFLFLNCIFPCLSEAENSTDQVMDVFIGFCNKNCCHAINATLFEVSSVQLPGDSEALLVLGRPQIPCLLIDRVFAFFYLT